MPVASKQLGHAASVGTGTTDLYTVPSGHTTIVKSVVVRNLSGSATIASFGINAFGSDKGYFRAYMAAAGTNGDTVILQPWLVMEYPDKLQCASGGGNFSVIVSGAELVG